MTDEIKDEVVTEEVKTPEEIAEKMFDKSENEGEDVTPKDEDKSAETQEAEGQEEKAEAEQAEEQEETTEETKPLELELSLSKDSPLDEGYIEAVKEFAKENELSQDEAQGILSHKEDAVLDYIEDGKAKLNTQADESLKVMKAKYGDKFNEAQEMALKPLKDPRFIGDGEDEQKLHDFMKETRVIDNQIFFEMFKKIGEAMSDDKYLKASTPTAKPKSREERFFGSQAANKE